MVNNPPANAGDTGSIPGLRRSHMLQSKEILAPQVLSMCSGAQGAETTEPPCHNNWSPRTHAKTREATTMRSPRTTTEEEPLLTTNREKPRKQPRSIHPKINNNNNKASNQPVRGVLMSSVLSRHNKNLKWQTLKPLVCHSSRTVWQLCVTTHSYLENKSKYILKGWGQADPKDVKRREREWERARVRGRKRPPGPLAPLFICFFVPPGPALCKLG